MPHPKPFNFIDRWEEPIWKKIGVYLWSIEHRGDYLVSYVGQTSARGGFDARIWQEYKFWESGRDRPVDTQLYLDGRRRELPHRPADYPLGEIIALKPHLRLWLMPLFHEDECVQAERWLVSQLCRPAATRQFLANVDPDGYCADPNWSVRIEAPPEFRVFGLTVPPPAPSP
jgi:hypothetical protein